MYKVEYLITVDQKEPFCKTIVAFNNLLKTIDGLVIQKNEIKCEQLVIHYEVQMGEIQRDKQRFFHVKFSCSEHQQVSDFEEFLRSIRGLLQKASGKPPQVLWDGLSFNYAQTAYPKVHEIENTMRKLITKFMLINVGVGWTKEAIPKEVSESVRSKDAKLDHNYLYEVDFIQLSNFLFKEYATINSAAIIDRLRKADNVSDLNLVELKLAIPRSNWDRFFSRVVNCESDYLKVRWERLYEKRNQVAHNKPVSRADYNEICSLNDDLLPKLQQAIDNLDAVTVSEDERELVSENVATTKGMEYSEFLSGWNDLQYHLYVIARLMTDSPEEADLVIQEKNDMRKLLDFIQTKGKVLTTGQHEGVLELMSLRNYMVHQPDVVIESSALSYWMAELHAVTHVIRGIIERLVARNSPPNDKGSVS